MFQLRIGQNTFQNPEDFFGDMEGFSDLEQAAIAFCNAWIAGNETFYQQSSGSTGNPKTIELHRNQMIASANATGDFFNVDESTRLLCCLNPSYIAGKMMLVRAMVWNCQIELVEPSSNPLLEISEYKLPDFVAMVPLQVQTILEDSNSLEKLRKIRHIIIGGAPLSENLKTLLVSNGIRAFQTYGMTETVSHISLARIETGNLVYQALKNVEIGQDNRGALWVKSAMSGLERVQTNDLVDLKSENSFCWLGRADFVINSGGVKIHPELLETKSESTIAGFFPNSAYFFFGLKDPKLGDKLALFIQTDEKDSEKAGLLQTELKLKLDRFEVPKEIHLIPKFEITSSGKLDRIKTVKLL
ncbi:MAG: AMP-binding protein [Algoriphagus sp.]|nr:AMP-binding protein [Algoriphagus sp.]